MFAGEIGSPVTWQITYCREAESSTQYMNMDSSCPVTLLSVLHWSCHEPPDTYSNIQTTYAFALTREKQYSYETMVHCEHENYNACFIFFQVTQVYKMVGYLFIHEQYMKNGYENH